MKTYQICNQCIMDTTDPDIHFNEHGICNHCLKYTIQAKPIVDRANSGEAEYDLLRLVTQIKRQAVGAKYDCVIGLSGGVDSTYVALKVKDLGLRPLAVHFDSGWNSELAVSNIENIVRTLGIDLITFVVDWEEMRDLQLSFLKSSVANCDTPTDHAFLSVLYKTAAKYRIHNVITGTNYSTEFILPRSWGYSPADLVHLRAIHRLYGSGVLRQYPTLSFFERYIYYPLVCGIRTRRILNYMPFNRDAVKEEIINKLNWRDYGGKHHESIFTRFFQTCYLPKKFNFDKRRAHLSSLIVSGQITRDQALCELNSMPINIQCNNDDIVYVAKKLGISDFELLNIMEAPGKDYKLYPTEEYLYNIKDSIWSKYKRLRGITTARI